jgi:lipopolysaccharide/colanic/teichoic acid biosynthesis glycosyltransferase
MYKFRSMELQAPGEEKKAWTVKNDPRVTPVGKFLRRTSLDELPQLFNILRGDMSLVGPRPERACYYEAFEQYIHGFHQRLKVKPGITGLAQIKTRTTAPWDKRIEIDNEYVDGISVWQDIKIFFGTFAVVLFHKNVYPESKEQIDNAKKTAVSTPEK